MMFLKGLAFGFILAATVGPVWVPVLPAHRGLRRLTGLVSGMGKTLMARPIETRDDVGDGSLLKAFLSTLGLTLTNPPTILAFAAIFALCAPST
jgi:threonine/homoserine/homoserine lactone efflux protein